jgi:signal transduction histidine kinase
MNWILFGVCIIALIFAVRLFRLKRQLRNITAQLNKRTNENTAKKITVALIDRDLSQLAAAINRNLDFQKKLRIDMRRSELKLKDSIASLSHDLRTPLTSILGYLQLSLEPGCPSGKRRDYLETADDKAHTLKSMIGSLYELSALDIRETPLQAEKIDLNLLLGDVLAGQYEAFQRLGITLKLNLSGHPVWISGDPVACTRVIQNLLNNSLRYAKQNVEIRLQEEGDYVFFSICNPAPNLKDEDIKHLFERFYTADKSRSGKGSGLGLYIVKTLLEKMNGKIADVSLREHVLHIKVGFLLSQ